MTSADNWISERGSRARYDGNYLLARVIHLSRSKIWRWLATPRADGAEKGVRLFDGAEKTWQAAQKAADAIITDWDGKP